MGRIQLQHHQIKTLKMN